MDAINDIGFMHGFLIADEENYWDNQTQENTSDKEKDYLEQGDWLDGDDSLF